MSTFRTGSRRVGLFTATSAMAALALALPTSAAAVLPAKVVCRGQQEGFSGGTGAAGDPYVITTPQQLCEVELGLSAYYVLGNDIDLAGSAYSNWTPIGQQVDRDFEGSFDGAGKAIHHLTMSLTEGNLAGLFGALNGATVKNLTLDDVLITDQIPLLGDSPNVGSLAGSAYESTISDVSVSGQITVDGPGEANSIGGLIGSLSVPDPHLLPTLVTRATADVDISSNAMTVAQVGGLVGIVSNQSDGDATVVTDSVAKGDLEINATGGESGGFGGLIGATYTDSDGAIVVTRVGAQGNVNVRVRQDYNAASGGLVGVASYLTVSEAYASGAVTLSTAGSNTPIAGGLVGLSRNSAISQARATGPVSWSALPVSIPVTSAELQLPAAMGGLLGLSVMSTDVSNSYATGNVSGIPGTAGLVGNYGFVGGPGATTVTNSYATGQAAYGLIGPGFSAGTNGPQRQGGDPPPPPTLVTTSSYWDTDLSGVPAGSCANPALCGSGLPTAAMRTQSTFVGWSFAPAPGPGSVWGICSRAGVAGYPGTGYPYLWVLEGPVDCVAVPGPPQLTKAEAGNVSISVAWVPPTDDGGAPIGAYTVTATSSANTAMCASETTTCTVTGLTNGTLYTVSVVATNRKGNSPASNTLTATPVAPVAPPSDPPPTGDPLKYQPKAADVPPGKGAATINQASTPVTVTKDQVDGNQTIQGSGWSVGFQSRTLPGRAIILDAGVPQYALLQKVIVSLQGFVPNTQAKLYAAPSGVELGTINVSESGNASAGFTVPSTLLVGAVAFQLNGFINVTSGPGRMVAMATSSVVSANLGANMNLSTATTSAVSKASKLRVQSLPKCAKHYHFKVQRLVTTTTNGGSDEPVTTTKWKKVGSYTTKGKTQSRIINLPKGTYRAVVSAACGEPTTTSNTTTLVK